MPGKFCVSLTCAKDNPDKATVAFGIANASVASDKDTVVFLSTEGVRLAVKDIDGDARGDLVTGSGPDGGSRVTAYAGAGLGELFAFDAEPGFAGGVFVG